MKATFTSTLLLILLSACSQKEEVKLGCDCEGPTENIVQNALAIHNISGVRILGDSTSQGRYAMYCDPKVIDGKTIITQDTVNVSGKIRPVRNYGDWNYNDRIEVTEIRKK
ncbi:hypothetical protein M0L20_28735 [Spirosoma sp. RP8]|uniref:Lipoprotein n=1 Tax=Spirosoma liriopis TaxID=2937440 RepID=A0ABT0HUL4_9BACT|nr:hypothetical protein [Spirosoma liriopis]MCK8495887.1 hypothetical protein [Spirosoma liriopis]